MKKFLLLLLVILAVMLALVMTGCDEIVLPDDLAASSGLKMEKVWGGYEVVGIGSCQDSIVIIPNTYEGKKVVSIGEKAFNNCDQITTVVIPENVKTVKSSAFANCNYLDNVYIQNGVEKLEAMLFYPINAAIGAPVPDIYYEGTTSEFKKLEKWTISTGLSKPWYYTGIDTLIFSVYCTDGILEYNYNDRDNTPTFKAYDGTIECPYHVDNNNDYICDNCKKTLPGFKTEVSVEVSAGLGFTLSDDGKSYSVTAIGTCTDTKVVIPRTYSGKPVTSIGELAFSNCSSLTGVVIPSSVTSIGYAAFAGCSSLTSIVIPNSVTSMDRYAFSDCESLTGIVIPDSVTSIGNSAFRNCSSLTSVVIPDSVTSIGDKMFYNCSSLTSIVIPDSVTSIGNGAFWICSSLDSVVIPDSVTSIGDYAFYYCTNLTSIKYRGSNEQWNAISKDYSWNWNTGDYTITYNYKGK